MFRRSALRSNAEQEYACVSEVLDNSGQEAIQNALPIPSSSTDRYLFELLHPVTLAVWSCGALILTMLTFHPLLAALSFAISLLTLACVRGVKSMLMTLKTSLYMGMIIAFINPLVVPLGTHELVHIDTVIAGFPFVWGVYAEALAWGACAALVFMAVVVWFRVIGTWLTPDRALALFHGTLPTISLMISMSLRLVPLIVRRARLVMGTLRANSAAATSYKQGGRIFKRMYAALTPGYTRTALVLVAWTLEDSLRSATAMRARAYNSARQRTWFGARSLMLRDAIEVGVVMVLLIAAFVGMLPMTHFQFYPTLSEIRLSVGVIVAGWYWALPVVWLFFERVRG